MRNLLTLTVALALATTAMAANEAITFDVTDAGGGVLRIDYAIDALSDDMPVGISLTVSCSGDGNVADVIDGVLEVDPCFPVYIDDIHDIVTEAGFDPCDWNPTFPGDLDTPLAKADEAGKAANGAQAFAICMGRLDPCDVTSLTGTLCEIQLAGTGSTDVTVASDTLRGGTVGSVFAVTVNHFNGTFTTVTFDCMSVGDVIGDITIDQPIYDRWVAIGKPEVWCCVNNSMGDANVDGYTNANDTTPLLNAPLGAATTYNIANADLNRDGYVNANDTTPILNRLGQNVGTCPGVPVWPPLP